MPNRNADKRNEMRAEKQSSLYHLSSTLGRNMDGAISLFKEYGASAWADAFTTLGETVARELKSPIDRNYRLVLEIGPRNKPSHGQMTVAGRYATAEVYPGYLYLMDNDEYVRKRGPAAAGSRQIANVVFGKVSRRTIPMLMGDLNSPEYLDSLEFFLAGRDVEPKQKPKEIVDEALTGRIDDRLLNLGIAPQDFREYLTDVFKRGYSSDVELEAILSPAFTRDSRKWILDEGASTTTSPLLRQVAAKMGTGRMLSPDEYLYGLAYEAQYRTMDAAAIAGMLKENIEYLDRVKRLDLGETAQAARYLKDAETPPFVVRDKLKQSRMTRAEAYGIARVYPGLAELSEHINRAALNRYFTQSEWVAVVEAGKRFAEEFREKKKEGKRLSSDEQAIYDLVNVIERNDGETAREAAIRLYSIPRARATFSAMKTVYAKNELAKRGITTRLVPITDLEVEGVRESLDRLCYSRILPPYGNHVDPHVRYSTRCKAGFMSAVPVRNFVRKDVPVLRETVRFGVVPKSLKPEKLARLSRVVEDFEPVTPGLRKKIDELAKAERFGKDFRVSDFKLSELADIKYLSPSQRERIEQLCRGYKLDMKSSLF